MFVTMLLMLLTGQRVFGAIGFVSAAAALLLWGEGAIEMPYTATWKLFKWYPMLTLPLFIYMGYMISESGIANDLYRMFHVYFGGVKGGLAIGTMGMMVAISAMNGLSVAGMTKWVLWSIKKNTCLLKVMVGLIVYLGIMNGLKKNVI